MASPSTKKAKTTTTVVAPNVVAESQRVRINDVDVSDESGWRAVDRSRVDELKETFRKGQFGINLLRRPTCLWAHGKHILSTGGNILLLDGKHTFVALGELAKSTRLRLRKRTATRDQPRT